jgi:hypothetical protein
MRHSTNTSIRILLSEGSSTNVRETITALGPLGYTLDICDPNPMCMGRFSRYIHKVYQCPTSGSHPIEYLKYVIRLIKEHHYDVLFPANEQAYLFAWAKEYLQPIVGLAVADFSAFTRVQTKSAFIRFLDELELPHPPTQIVSTWHEIEQLAAIFPKPFYLKTSYGTASTGVWRIQHQEDLPQIKEELDKQKIWEEPAEFLIQETDPGYFEQSHTIFDHGQLIALHCTRRMSIGAGGGAAVKIGVNRPIVWQHFKKLGQYLDWHGSLSIDYFWDDETEQPSYIDANPRITEPMNAVINGINVADLQVQLSLGKKIAPLLPTHTSLRSHNTIQSMMNAAGNPPPRINILKELYQVTRKKGMYEGSREGMTPVSQDTPSFVPLISVLTNLLIDPRSTQRIATNAISHYSLGMAIPKLLTMSPEGIF